MTARQIAYESCERIEVVRLYLFLKKVFSNKTSATLAKIIGYLI